MTDQKSSSYGLELASTTFCGVLPGWGWSGRMEDAVLHGCIPVILQDGIHTPWESVLDARSYSVRVRREDMAQMVSMLRAMPQARVRELQVALAEAWPRFSYLGNVRAEEARHGRPSSALAEAAAARDATATLLQVLRTRLLLRDARREAAAKGSFKGGAATAARGVAGELAPAPGCQISEAGGGDVSPPEDPHAAEPTFEGRKVNGWVI